MRKQTARAPSVKHELLCFISHSRITPLFLCSDRMAANKVTAVHGKCWEEFPSFDLKAAGGSAALFLV
jgi:hypothetical protein